MPIFGVRVEQTKGPIPFSNRFYTVADTLTGALDNGVDFWSAVRPAFADAVVNTKIHAWVIGVSPNVFDNRPRSVPGINVLSANLKPEIVARYQYGAQSSYPYYHDLRLCVSQDQIDGENWSSDFQVILDVVLANLQTLVGADKIVMKNGDSLGNVSYFTDYKFHQLHKRWYNRTTTP